MAISSETDYEFTQTTPPGPPLFREVAEAFKGGLYRIDGVIGRAPALADQEVFQPAHIAHGGSRELEGPHALVSKCASRPSHSSAIASARDADSPVLSQSARRRSASDYFVVERFTDDPGGECGDSLPIHSAGGT